MQGLAKAGKVAEALAEAKICLDHCAGDADSQIDIVNAFRDAGRPEADAAYDRAKSLYTELAARRPGDSPAASPPADNLLAWFECRCGRDLDDALARATRAAEAEPENTAILDTLAEVHFRRGETDRALELVRRCIKLEPNSEHHKKNLERFAAKAKGAGGTTRPGA